jgi:hypothetical protein
MNYFSVTLVITIKPNVVDRHSFQSQILLSGEFLIARFPDDEPVSAYISLKFHQAEIPSGDLGEWNVAQPLANVIIFLSKDSKNSGNFLTAGASGNFFTCLWGDRNQPCVAPNPLPVNQCGPCHNAVSHDLRHPGCISWVYKILSIRTKGIIHRRYCHALKFSASPAIATL